MTSIIASFFCNNCKIANGRCNISTIASVLATDTLIIAVIVNIATNIALDRAIIDAIIAIIELLQNYACNN